MASFGEQKIGNLPKYESPPTKDSW